MSKISLTICFLALFSCFMKETYSQDVHFSQRLVGDRQLNPSFSNHFEGNFQIITAYRQQWQSVGVPFTTGSFACTKKFKTNIPVLEWFAGIAYTNDKSGDAKLTINQIQLNAGASYHYLQHKFSFGVQNGFVSKSFNQNGLTFPTQYDRNTGGFNETLGNGESFAGENTSFYDVSIGALWETELSNDWSLASGLSINHLLEPKESFFDRSNQKNRGVGLQALAEKQLNERFALHPYLSYYWARGASEMLVGSAVSFPLNGFKKVDELKPFLYLRTGIDRTTDALIIGSRATIGKFDLGLSYDINISDLELASNYQGGLELSLIFTARNPQLKNIRIPCERY
jgi:type IX secretion system PorP/SprF family membrane protein